jgi:hypothetical protein
MNKYGMAREAKALSLQIELMNSLEPHEVDTFLLDVRARIGQMGLSLEDVIVAGIHRLGRVPSAIVRHVEDEPDFPPLVTDRNWRAEVRELLDRRSDYIRWVDCTFLRCMLVKDEATIPDLARIESLISRALEQEYEMLIAAQGPTSAPDYQLPLEI